MRGEGGKRFVWGTRFAFYFAAIGSAFGLGNLWRFPYVVSENGGGAFVLLYVVLVFVLGMPFLIGELLLGKISRSSLVPAIMKISGSRHSSVELREPTLMWPAKLIDFLPKISQLSLFICAIVLAYYAVISGWVLYFISQMFVKLISAENGSSTHMLATLMESGWLQVAFAGLHLLVVAFVVAKDLDQGLEKWVGYVMPAFGILLLLLAVHSLNLPSAPDALRFLFYPDFSKLTPSAVGRAVGHVFFTLSVGFGAMVTFGSYLRDRTYLPLAGFRVATLDSVISIFAGVMIFPLAMMSHTPQESGPEILFQSIEVLIGSVSGGTWFGLAFFLCLYLAALGASIGLLETIVSNMREMRRIHRFRASFLLAGACWVIALLPALSSNYFAAYRVGQQGLLELMDSVIINWLLPIAALLISQIVGHALRRELMDREFIDPLDPSSKVLYRQWSFALRFVATPIVFLGLVLQIIDLL